MQFQQLTLQKLSRYGIRPTEESKKSIQQKIIQMYELLEQKTTQNLFLRKDNDDIKLQINTINQLFSTDEQNLLNCLQKQHFDYQTNCIQSPENSHQEIKQKRKIAKKQNYLPEYEIYEDFQEQQKPEKFQIQARMNKEDNYYNDYSKYKSAKTHLNSVFYGQSKRKTVEGNQITSRKSTQKIEKQEINLNQKIEYLINQNLTILKRMNHIENNLISNDCQQKTLRRTQKNQFDDRQTNFSTNVTSIHNIWSKKDSFSDKKQVIRHSRKHYSTNNLRQYCPSLTK